MGEVVVVVLVVVTWVGRAELAVVTALTSPCLLDTACTIIPITILRKMDGV